MRCWLRVCFDGFVAVPPPACIVSAFDFLVEEAHFCLRLISPECCMVPGDQPLR